MYTKDHLAHQVETAGFRIGEFSYGCPQILSWGEGTKLEVGRYCSIAEGCKIFLGGNHRTDWVSTYPFSHIADWGSAKEIVGHPCSNGDVSIGNDVWIGAFATILSGIRIGDGAVIAAGAMITKDVAPYSVVGGNPGKFIKYRFDETIRNNLLEIRWWDWPADLVRALCPALCSDNIENFVRVGGRINEALRMMAEPDARAPSFDVFVASGDRMPPADNVAALRAIGDQMRA